MVKTKKKSKAVLNTEEETIQRMAAMMKHDSLLVEYALRLACNDEDEGQVIQDAIRTVNSEW